MRELGESDEMPSDDPEILPHALRKMMLLRLGQHQLGSRQRDRQRVGEARHNCVQGAQPLVPERTQDLPDPSVVVAPMRQYLPESRRETASERYQCWLRSALRAARGTSAFGITC